MASRMSLRVFKVVFEPLIINLRCQFTYIAKTDDAYTVHPFGMDNQQNRQPAENISKRLRSFLTIANEHDKQKAHPASDGLLRDLLLYCRQTGISPDPDPSAHGPESCHTDLHLPAD